MHFFMVGGIIDGYESWEEAMDAQPQEPISDEKNGVPMLYSSGTTGQPKGVFVPPTSDDVDDPQPLAVSLGVAFGFSEETVYLSPAPLYHAAPLHYNMMNHLPGRDLGDHGEVRPGARPGADRGAPGHAQPVGADHVYPHA